MNVDNLYSPISLVDFIVEILEHWSKLLTGRSPLAAKVKTYIFFHMKKVVCSNVLTLRVYEKVSYELYQLV